MQTDCAAKFDTARTRFDRGALPQFRAFTSTVRTALADASGADRAAIAGELASLGERLEALREFAEGTGTFAERTAEHERRKAEWDRVRGTPGPVEDLALQELCEAATDLLLTPAPDLQALALKLRICAEYEIHEDLNAGEIAACLAEDGERLAREAAGPVAKGS